jgi:hypothetical protein
MPKKTPEEILRAIENPSPDEEIERALAMTDEEVNRELEDAGYTPEELVAMEEKLLGPAAPAPAAETKTPTPAPQNHPKQPAKVIPLRPRAALLWARVAAAAAVLGPVGYAALAEIEPYALVGSAPDGGPDLLEAKSLREKAASALQAGQASRCLTLLDAAKELDPEGDRDPAVMRTRREAMEKLGIGDGAPGR